MASREFQSRILIDVFKQERDIYFFPLSESMSLQQPFKKQDVFNIFPGMLDPPVLLSWKIDMELLNGPYLISCGPIPLLVKLTKTCACHCSVQLNDFQTTLIETTEIRAKHYNQSSQQIWTVQTISNLKQKLLEGRAPLGTVVHLPESIWAPYTIPFALVPSFETCNIRRTYQLIVRVGLEIGLSKVGQAKSLLYSNSVFHYRC